MSISIHKNWIPILIAKSSPPKRPYNSTSKEDKLYTFSKNVIIFAKIVSNDSTTTHFTNSRVKRPICIQFEPGMMRLGPNEQKDLKLWFLLTEISHSITISSFPCQWQFFHLLALLLVLKTWKTSLIINLWSNLAPHV